MNRRGFFGALFGLAAAPLVARAVDVPITKVTLAELTPQKRLELATMLMAGSLEPGQAIHYDRADHMHPFNEFPSNS